ncbi:DUF2332 domain-containing protein [Sphingomonas sp. CJ20]
MNMIASIAQQGELGRQAEVARQLGSPFVAAVLEAGERQLHRAPLTAAILSGWPGDPSAAAVAMRFNAALHALARRGVHPALSALYRWEHQDFDGAIAMALAADDAFVAEWLHHTPQTNEVGRAAAIGAALMAAGQGTRVPLELLELGSSCGLNLNLARYAYDLGGLHAGDPESAVKVAPEWCGGPPPAAPLDVVSARGVDLNPLDARDERTHERLLAYIWADQPRRAARLEEALALARRYPPAVERGNAVTWLAERLAEPQRAGVCRAVFHSMFLQYLRREECDTIVQTIRRAGSRATIARPLVWISLEWTEGRREVQLWSTRWPHGESRLLATCHAYGNWVDWRG